MATENTAPKLALLGLAVVVAGAGVVVFAATWLWPAGMEVLGIEEAVDGAIVVDETDAVVAAAVVGVVVVGGTVEVVEVGSGSLVTSGALVGASVGGVVTLSPFDAKPVTWPSA